MRKKNSFCEDKREAGVSQEPYLGFSGLMRLLAERCGGHHKQGKTGLECPAGQLGCFS